MCAPVIAGLGKAFTAAKAAAGTLGTISTGLTAVGGAVSAIGAYQQGRVAKAAAAQTAAAQAQAAQQSLEAGREASDRQRRAGAAAVANQRAMMAANGVDVGGADALSILDETRDFSGADAFAIREDARRSAQAGYQASANSLTQGSADARSGSYRAIGTLLTTGARVGQKYSHWAVDNREAFR